MLTWTRGVIALDLATKLTHEDGNTAMDVEESLAQHGFADYTLVPREGLLTARRLLRSTKKAPFSLAANRFLVDERPMASAVSIFHATAFSSRVFNVVFGLPAMASCSIAAASRSVEVTNRPNRL